MKPKNKKSVLITIIVLLVIFVPLAAVGTITHFKNVSSGKSDINKNHDLYFNGKLYFYNGDVELGTYECSNKICDYAYQKNDDKKYEFNYIPFSENQISMVGNKYAFIIDTDAENVNEGYDNISVNLYNVVQGVNLFTFDGVKSYDNRYFLVQNSEKLWGVMLFEGDPRLTIQYAYKYIGYGNNSYNVDDNSTVFAVLNDEGWKLIDSMDTALTSYFNNPIYDFNTNVVITKNDNGYVINNYQAEPIFNDIYKDIKFIDKYLGVINNMDEFYIISTTSNMEITEKYPVTSFDDVTYENTENGLDIKVNGESISLLND